MAEPGMCTPFLTDNALPIPIAGPSTACHPEPDPTPFGLCIVPVTLGKRWKHTTELTWYE